MNKPKFVYVTYIATTPEKLWQALTDPEFTRQYWSGRCLESDWRPGSRFVNWCDAAHGDLDFAGTVLESDPPRRLVYTFGEQWGEWVRGSVHKEVVNEPPSRVTYTLEPAGTPESPVVKLTVIHDELDERGQTFKSISNGWPAILSNLKSLLEVGHSLEIDEKGCH